jgi:hypothetical protein
MSTRKYLSILGLLGLVLGISLVSVQMARLIWLPQPHFSGELSPGETSRSPVLSLPPGLKICVAIEAELHTSAVRLVGGKEIRFRGN